MAAIMRFCAAQRILCTSFRHIRLTQVKTNYSTGSDDEIKNMKPKSITPQTIQVDELIQHKNKLRELLKDKRSLGQNMPGNDKTVDSDSFFIKETPMFDNIQKTLVPNEKKSKNVDRGTRSTSSKKFDTSSKLSEIQQKMSFSNLPVELQMAYNKSEDPDEVTVLTPKEPFDLTTVDVDIGKTPVDDTNGKPDVSFATMLRNSTVMMIGEFKGARLIGHIVEIQDDDLYIDFGGKFYCVCPRPESKGDYFKGRTVDILLHEWEMTSKFIGSERHTTLLEADATLLGVSRVRKDTGIELNTYNAGIELNTDNVGIEVNTDTTGIELNTDNTGIELNTDNAGIEVNIDNAGFELNTNNAGIELNTDNAGIEVNTNNAGIEMNTDNTSKEVNTDATGIEVNTDNTSKEVNTDKLV